MRPAATHGANEDGSALVRTSVFDHMPAPEAMALLRPCCASGRWAAQLMAGRPYGWLRQMLAASDDVMADLSWGDLAEALAAHPRIGEQAAGPGREASWSRQEQRDVAGSAVAEQLLAGNLAYEERFGHVFLICATGKTPEQMLTALRLRLGNPTEVERGVIRAELGAIVRLRLIKTFR